METGGNCASEDSPPHVFQLYSRHKATKIPSVLPFYPHTRQRIKVLIASKCKHLYVEVIITSHMCSTAVTGFDWTDGVYWSRRRGAGCVCVK